MSRSARTALGASRLSVGALSLVAPERAARVFGVDPRRSSPWLTRLFASREIVLAGALLRADASSVRTVALLGAGIDALDVASSAVEAGSGRIGGWTRLSGGGGAVLFCVLGLLAAREG